LDQQREGRPSTDPEAADKLDKNFEKYRKSEKGRKAFERYAKSNKGIETRKKYSKSDKGKQNQARFMQSEKGQEYLKDRKLRILLFKQAAKLQDDHPDWTSEKCLEKAHKLLNNEGD